MEFLYIISIFSLIGFLTITGYLFLDFTKKQYKENEEYEFLKEKIDYLEQYIYELEEKVAPLTDEVKNKIIQMYQDGKTLMVIENALNLPKTKIEMVLKEYIKRNKE